MVVCAYKFIISLAVVLFLVAISTAQRPSFAGLTPKDHPELASRFRDPNDTADPFIGNRLGETNPNLPTDARGDEQLVNKVSQWPREHQPFWLLNREHLERHRHPNGNNRLPINNTQPTVQQFASRNNFGANNDAVVGSNIGSVNGTTGTYNRLPVNNKPQFENRNNFDNGVIEGTNIEIVNGIPGTFNKRLDGTVIVSSRADFDGSDSIPAKPAPPRSSFLPPLPNN